MTQPAGSAFLMAYFHPEEHSDGQQIRFAVSGVDDACTWTPLNDGLPVVRTEIGERGARDPFLIRDESRDRFILIATDLRVQSSDDWDRAVRRGSQGILVWESPDLLTWSGPQLRPISPADAGNTWAPKAFWSKQKGCWVVIWASALYGDHPAASPHQRLLAADTRDFITFINRRTYLDPGHDVIDATFLQTQDGWYRFSANAQAPGTPADIGHHIFVELGRDLEDPAFRSVTVDLGRAQLVHAEGPAVFRTPGSDTAYLLMDEFGLRGYQLFSADVKDIGASRWHHLSDAELPPNARHGSVIPITIRERDALLGKRW